jgi:uncharacterized protein
MEPISIPNLAQSPERSETHEFKEPFPDLGTLLPVQGVVTVMHQGNYLEVMAQADTIVTLRCDRCLQNYNQRLLLDASEMIWLSDAAADFESLPFDEDLKLDEMVEHMPRNGHFDVKTWVYEQLCLELPQHQLCSDDCVGIAVAVPEREADRRWASLESLKGQLPNA